jgi:molecular chaperone DnaK
MDKRMVYQLGIDFGTTFTAAAVCRPSSGSGGAEVVPLSLRGSAAASVLFLAEDGTVLVGEAAERRAVSDPERVVREFKRRIGDDIPFMVAGEAHQAHELAAQVVRWVYEQVAAREGDEPDNLAITHPAGWGEHKKTLLRRALCDVGLYDAVFLSEPQAAALNYANAERVPVGSTIAVYDLGGGTFDTAVVRKTDAVTFELLGRAEGIESLGGIDFDDAVFEHVRNVLGDVLDDLDPTDPVAMTAFARLRRECTEAKEALSTDTETTIPVLLPNVRTQVRMVRAELEAMVRPALEQTIEVLGSAVSSAGLTMDELTSVLLVGGSSRVPLVPQLISERLRRPVAVDTDPTAAVAQGAALAVAAAWSPPVFDDCATTATTAVFEGPPTRPVVEDIIPLQQGKPAPRRRISPLPFVIAGVLGIAVLGVFVAGFIRLPGASVGESTSTTTTTTGTQQASPGGQAGQPVTPADGERQRQAMGGKPTDTRSSGAGVPSGSNAARTSTTPASTSATTDGHTPPGDTTPVVPTSLSSHVSTPPTTTVVPTTVPTTTQSTSAPSASTHDHH